MSARVVATGVGTESGIPAEYRLECTSEVLSYTLYVKYDFEKVPSMNGIWLVAAKTATAQSAYRIVADDTTWTHVVGD